MRQRRGFDRAARQASEAPAQQTSTSVQISAQADGPAPPAPWRAAAPAVATTKAQEPIEAPTGAGADTVRFKAGARASGDAEGTARGGDDAAVTGSPTAAPMKMLMKIFLILVLVLAVAGIVSRFVIKIAAARRARVIIDHPEFDWVEDPTPTSLARQSRPVWIRR